MSFAPHKKLRSGFTTGACAAAAAKGAALMLARQEKIPQVKITLPQGIEVVFQLHGQTFSKTCASCYVIKDAGDDPDITNGAELHAKVTLSPPPSTGMCANLSKNALGFLPPFQGEGRGGDGIVCVKSASYHHLPHPPPNLPLEGGGTKYSKLALMPSTGGGILITGGSGIGKVTKPGLAVAPGEYAINPVPRKMIADAVNEAFQTSAFQPGLNVEISIPDGEERAKKTLNARLGIIGGLSILGTTGIVRPISAKAWTDTIDTSLEVARACGCTTVVLSTGRTSELAAQRHLREKGHLPEEAFIMMGDHVAHAVNACQERGFDRPIITCQFAKLLKIACGYENTHAAASELDLSRLREWAEANRFPQSLLDTITTANTAREIIIASHFNQPLLKLVALQARHAICRFSPVLQSEILVADYAGRIAFHLR